MEKYDSEIFKISKDEERAKDLLDMAKERIDFAVKYVPKDIPYRLLEEYYEVAVQLMTSIMYADGYKTLSHISLIEYLKNYNEFNTYELEMLDRMRKARHGAVYYGKKDGGNFFLNHQNEIKILINKLNNLASRKSESKILLDIFKKVQKIPYQVCKFTKEDINENIKSGDCRHKSELLFQLLKNSNFEVKRIKVIFNWSDLPVPEELLSTLKKSRTIWSHDSIMVKINKEWLKVDCTWNPELKSKGFPVTENWDGKSDTLQVTKGKLQFYDADIDNPDDFVIFCSGLSNRHSRKQTNLTNGNVYKYNNKIKINKEEAHKFADELNKWLIS